MSLQTIYESFLGNPDATSLAETASLNYITTLITINNAGSIATHLQSQNRLVVKKKAEKVIGAVEGPSALSLDVETTLEFISGGGAYLPGLENFVTDKVATFPAVSQAELKKRWHTVTLGPVTDKIQSFTLILLQIHIVHFDQDNKIQSIRVYWDQAALLKQVGIIGSRGNNWPIRDGKDQARLISLVRSTAAKPQPPIASSTRGRVADEVVDVARSHSPNKKHIKDPYSSLDLFGAGKADSNVRESSSGAIAPRKSAKPPPREMSELFAAGHEDHEPGPPGSPKKENRSPVIAPKAKGTGGQNYQPSRLFDPESASQESEALYKSNPAKYNHFDLGDASEVDQFQHNKGPTATTTMVPLRAKTNKHASQWDFSDFMTPEKVRTKIRGQDVRNFGWSDDEGEKAETPGKHPKVVQPRPDSQVHFELQDDGMPADVKRPAGRPKGSLHNSGLGLYQNNLYQEDGPETVQKENEPLKNVTNNIGRNKDFENHWTIADSSPITDGKTNKENKPLGENHQKAVNMMAPHWDTYDESPEQVKKQAGAKGLRKGQETHWGFDNHSSEQAGGKKVGGNFWDF